MLAALGALSFAASAQARMADAPHVMTRAEAIAEDAAQYAVRFAVANEEAVRRLRAQQSTATVTDAIAAEFRNRLAGIAIEHAPEYRIVVLLTGSEPVADRLASGVPIVFRTGAKATRDQAILAMRRHLIDLRAELPGARGAGYDQRTGEVVLLVPGVDAQRLGLNEIKARAEQLGGVPVRVVINDLIEQNAAVAGGGLVRGTTNGSRFRCTTGFVVTDGSRTGVATAAHCPDELTYYDQSGAETPLPFVTQSGLAYQDVQINLAPDGTRPSFYSDRQAGSLRPVASWRNQASIRAGEFVCHWGESSGYSCAEVELTDYAPAAALCGGPCQPTWITVEGPNCAPGDSGGPVFSGTIALGIAKGINRTPAGGCNFYYFMSTDLLPPPWRLLVR